RGITLDGTGAKGRVDYVYYGPGNYGAFVLDSSLTVLGSGAGWGEGLGLNAGLGYRVTDGDIDVIDTAHLQVIGAIPITDTLQSGSGHLAISPGGTVVVVATDNGVTLG